MLSPFICPSLGAQEVPPALFVRMEGELEALRVSSVSIETRIIGPISETRMTLKFYNGSQRQLEGDLYFPLPEGATVSGYALDVAGVLIDGVAVEKAKGRQVFERIQRQGIDPGLVEWTRGSNFKTRVFPIPARGSRTVMVRYLAELKEQSGNLVYRLPLRFRDRVDDFTLSVEVVSPGGSPEVLPGDLGGFDVHRRRDGYLIETRRKAVVLDGDIVVRVPTATEPEETMIERAADGETYFLLSHKPSPLDPDPGPSPGRSVNRLTVYWDASASRQEADHERILRFLASFFREHRQHPMTVYLVVFRNEAEPPVSFLVENGNGQELIDALRKIVYDGGTQIGSIPAPDEDMDLAILFTDGLSTFGYPEPLGLRTPLFILSTAVGADHPFLQHLAHSHGGEYFNMLSWQDREILGRLERPGLQFLGMRVEEGRIEEGYPNAMRPISGRLVFVGKLGSPRARIRLLFGSDGGATEEAKFEIDGSEAGTGELLRSVWAQKKLQELLVFAGRNRSLMVELGKEMGLVTPSTSLIVLESLDQYVENSIPPPPSLPDMRREYFVLLEQRRRQDKQQQESKLTRILSLWAERVAWWQQEFVYQEGFRFQEQEEAAAGVPAAGVPAAEGGAEEEAPAAPEPAFREEAALDTEAERSVSGVDEEDLGEPERKGDGEPGGESAAPEIVVNPWDPDTPYLVALRKTPKGGMYEAYLSLREAYGGSPAFYLDCGDYFLEQSFPDLALRIWSNVSELALENAPLLRVLAHRLARNERLDLSRLLFEEVLRIRPEEPQSYRDLALVLARMGRYERAIELLNRVVLGHWERFDEIELIALMELNRLIPKAWAAGLRELPVDPRLVQLLDVDIRVVLSWDADLTDMDLWVTEPSLERAYYGNRRTTIGGHFSRDFTDGYGPEEYLLKKAMQGSYRIEVDYFGSSALSLSGSVILQVDIFTHYGRPNEHRQTLSVRLTESSEPLLVGEITF
jgi:tetratricopeptide (TPR) repeat protein